MGEGRGRRAHPAGPAPRPPTGRGHRTFSGRASYSPARMGGRERRLAVRAASPYRYTAGGLAGQALGRRALQDPHSRSSVLLAAPPSLSPVRWALCMGQDPSSAHPCCPCTDAPEKAIAHPQQGLEGYSCFSPKCIFIERATRPQIKERGGEKTKLTTSSDTCTGQVTPVHQPHCRGLDLCPGSQVRLLPCAGLFLDLVNFPKRLFRAPHPSCSSPLQSGYSVPASLTAGTLSLWFVPLQEKWDIFLPVKNLHGRVFGFFS